MKCCYCEKVQHRLFLSFVLCLLISLTRIIINDNIVFIPYRIIHVNVMNRKRNVYNQKEIATMTTILQNDTRKKLQQQQLNNTIRSQNQTQPTTTNGSPGSPRKDSSIIKNSKNQTKRRRRITNTNKAVRIQPNNDKNDVLTILSSLSSSSSSAVLLSSLSNDNVSTTQLVVGDNSFVNTTIGDKQKYKKYITKVQIPKQFQKDSILLSESSLSSSSLSFPRWDDYNTSVFETILDYIIVTSNTYQYLQALRKNIAINFTSNFPIPYIGSYIINHTNDHTNDVIWWFPETVYIISGIDTPILRYSKTTQQYNYNTELALKQYPTEDMIYTTIQKFIQHKGLIKDSSSSSSSSSTGSGKHRRQQQKHKHKQRWPRLYKLLVVDNSSFPFISWYGDYTGCNYHNWNINSSNSNSNSNSSNYKQVSLPLFTVAANIQCNNTFPFPNYQTIRDVAKLEETRQNNKEQSNLQNQQQQINQWLHKIPQVIWRGGLTGKLPKNESQRCIRYQLLKYVHDTNRLTEVQRNMFNIKLVSIPHYFHRGNVDTKYIRNATTTSILGTVSKSNYIPMNDYEKYRAILDVDGQSWSSRFGTLLCTSSIVVKIEPQYVDYFNYKKDYDTTNRTKKLESLLLQPWQHYIPIKYDLSDLLEKVQFVLNDTNAILINQIISNANVWCANQMTYQSISIDILDTFEQYIHVLDHSSSLWESKWKQVQESISNGPYNMVPYSRH